MQRESLRHSDLANKFVIPDLALSRCLFVSLTLTFLPLVTLFALFSFSGIKGYKTS